MAAVAEETTLIEVEVTEVTIVPIMEFTMVMEEVALMEGIVEDARALKLAETVVHTMVVVRLAVETRVAGAQALKLAEAVVHTTAVVRLVVETRVAGVAAVAQEMAVAKARMAAEAVAHVDQDR